MEMPCQPAAQSTPPLARGATQAPPDGLGHVRCSCVSGPGPEKVPLLDLPVLRSKSEAARSTGVGEDPRSWRVVTV